MKKQVVAMSFVLLFLTFGTSVSGCAKKVKGDTSANDVLMRKVKKLIVSSVHFRRPEGAGADLTAGPGGEDYRAKPLPNEKLDCQTQKEFFKDTNTQELRTCLVGLTDPLVLTFNLVRNFRPYWELVEDPKIPVPDCVKATLSKIPLPREIFFQSNVENFLSCYSARLNLEADEFLYVKVPRAQMQMQIKIPFEPALTGFSPEEAMQRVLFSWVMTPFWENPEHYLNAKILPEGMCKACMGEKAMVNEKGIIELWPAK